MYNNLKTRTFEIVQLSKDDDLASKIFDVALISLIIINIIMVIAETFKIPVNVQTAIKYAETISVIIFTIEYLVRVWTSDLLYPDSHPVIARIRFIFSFMAIIDLLSILPFYIPMIIPVDLRVLRALRILRLFQQVSSLPGSWRCLRRRRTSIRNATARNNIAHIAGIS